MSILVSQKTRRKIFDELIEPIYYKDIDDCIYNRKLWKSLYHIFQGISKFVAGTSTVLSFASAMFANRALLSFMAGSLNVIAMVFQQFATYSIKEHKINNDELNKILEKIQIHSVTDLLEEEEIPCEK